MFPSSVHYLVDGMALGLWKLNWILQTATKTHTHFFKSWKVLKHILKMNIYQKDSLVSFIRKIILVFARHCCWKGSQVVLFPSLFFIFLTVVLNFWRVVSPCFGYRNSDVPLICVLFLQSCFRDACPCNTELPPTPPRSQGWHHLPSCLLTFFLCLRCGNAISITMLLNVQRNSNLTACRDGLLKGVWTLERHIRCHHRIQDGEKRTTNANTRLLAVKCSKHE